MPKKKEEVSAEISYRGRTAILGSSEGDALIEDMIRHGLGLSGKVGILTPAKLLSMTQMLRTLVIGNAHRIPKFRPIADRLGSIETILIDGAVEVEDKQQEKLPLDRSREK